jgi:hypothetical protein
MADENYSDEETKRRFEAALRGSRLVSPQPMKEIPRKRPKADNAMNQVEVKRSPKR